MIEKIFVELIILINNIEPSLLLLRAGDVGATERGCVAKEVEGRDSDVSGINSTAVQCFALNARQ